MTTDEDCSLKLALNKAEGRGNLKKLTSNVTQTQSLQSPSNELNFVVT